MPLRYSSTRHRQLMEASEFALQEAAESPLPRESRIASTVLNDGSKYRHWELRHADLLVPVAEQRANHLHDAVLPAQILAVRSEYLEEPLDLRLFDR